MKNFIRKNLIYILLALAILLNVSGYARIQLTTPFIEAQDLFTHMKHADQIIETQTLDFTYNSISSTPPLYQFFPLLHILMAETNLLTGIPIPYIAIILDVLQVILIPLLLFGLGSMLFRNKLIGLLVAVLFMFPGGWVNVAGIGFYMFTATPWFSLIAFLAALIMVLRCYAHPENYRLLFVYSTFVFGIILYHPQSSLGRVAILGLVHLLVMLGTKRTEIKTAAKLLGATIIPGIIFLLINIPNLHYFLTLGNQFTDGDTSLAQSATATVISHVNILNSFGPIILIFSIAGFAIVYLLRNHLAARLTKVIILAMILVDLVGIYQSKLGLFFFAHRYQAELLYPLILLAGVGFYILLHNLRKSKLGMSLVACIVLLLLFPPVQYLFTKTFSLDINYVKAMIWASDNIKYSTVMADPYTFYAFNSINTLSAPYRAVRPNSTVYNSLQANSPAFKNIFQGTATESYTYAKENGVQYIIIDYKNNKNRLIANYDNFKNTNYFEVVYSTPRNNASDEDILTIYRVL